MLQDLYELEEYLGKIEAVQPLSLLMARYDPYAVAQALNEGLLMTYQVGKFSGGRKTAELFCGLTEKARAEKARAEKARCKIQEKAENLQPDQKKISICPMRRQENKQRIFVPEYAL